MPHEMAVAGGRARLRDVQPVPQADTESLGTLTVEPAFDPALVTFVDGSGSISPNPASEDELITFCVDVDNQNDVSATYDLEFVSADGKLWAQTNVTDDPGITTWCIQMVFTPQELGFPPGDYTISAELFNVATASTAAAIIDGQALGIDRSTWATGLAGLGVGVAALGALGG